MPAVTPLVKRRLLSLDAFRGFTIAGMVLVNNAGGFPETYSQLKHSVWNGLTFTDVIFPFFLWISGVAMTFSFAGRVERGEDRGKLLLHSARRALILFVIGLFLNAFPEFHLADWRIPGVLQRIALCYLAAAAVYLYFGRRGQAAWIVGLNAVYWGLMKYYPVPGLGAGRLERGQNFAAYVDRIFLSGHLYGATKTWDPEGIVSTLPAITTTLLGVLVGSLLRSSWTPMRKAKWMTGSGAALLAAGWMLSAGMPINKALWTTPYVLVTAGLASIALAGCSLLLDFREQPESSGLSAKVAWPFVVYGRNAIAAYVVHGLLEKLMSEVTLNVQGNWTPLDALYARGLLEPAFGAANASVLYALTHVLVVFLVVYGMHRRGWYLRV